MWRKEEIFFTAYHVKIGKLRNNCSKVSLWPSFLFVKLLDGRTSATEGEWKLFLLVGYELSFEHSNCKHTMVKPVAQTITSKGNVSPTRKTSHKKFPLHRKKNHYQLWKRYHLPLWLQYHLTVMWYWGGGGLQDSQRRREFFGIQ